MRRRRWFRAAAAFALLTGAAWAFALWYFARPIISHEQYRQIRRGMTLGEVQALLGYPPGNYIPTEGEWRARGMRGWLSTQGDERYAEWAAETMEPVVRSDGRDEAHFAFVIRVWLDDDGRVTHRRMAEYDYTTPTAGVRVRWWFRATLAKWGF